MAIGFDQEFAVIKRNDDKKKGGPKRPPSFVIQNQFDQRE